MLNYKAFKFKKLGGRIFYFCNRKITLPLPTLRVIFPARSENISQRLFIFP